MHVLAHNLHFNDSTKIEMYCKYVPEFETLIQMGCTLILNRNEASDHTVYNERVILRAKGEPLSHAYPS